MRRRRSGKDKGRDGEERQKRKRTVGKYGERMTGVEDNGGR